MSEQTKIMEEGTYKIVRITHKELRCNQCGKFICRIEKDEEPEDFVCPKCYDDSDSEKDTIKVKIEGAMQYLLSIL